MFKIILIGTIILLMITAVILSDIICQQEGVNIFYTLIGIFLAIVIQAFILSIYEYNGYELHKLPLTVHEIVIQDPDEELINNINESQQQ